MALGRRKNDQQVQQQMFVTTTSLPRSPGHPFYVALNKLLAEAKFDEFVEKLCAPLYSEGGRPSIPPGVYFRMLLVGYFENIDSQRGIAWRCCDSMSLRTFLGLQVTQASPDHSSLTVIRRRISKELIDEVFAFVLKIAVAKHVLKAGGAVGVDATTLEANAAMKSIRVFARPDISSKEPSSTNSGTDSRIRLDMPSSMRLTTIISGAVVARAR